MIKIKPVKSSKGFRLRITNTNGHKFNHLYNRKQDAKRAWNSFVKQIKEGKFEYEE